MGTKTVVIITKWFAHTRSPLFFCLKKIMLLPVFITFAEVVQEKLCPNITEGHLKIVYKYH